MYTYNTFICVTLNCFNPLLMFSEHVLFHPHQNLIVFALLPALCLLYYNDVIEGSDVGSATGWHPYKTICFQCLLLYRAERGHFSEVRIAKESV